MRRHLNYANVVATFALVFAMSGGALAANHYLINSTKQFSPKVLKKLTGKAGPKGSTGATGAQGSQGQAGKEGTAGSAVAYAHILGESNPGAVLDTANSKNVSAASKAPGAGLYCITTTVPIRNVSGTVDFGHSAAALIVTANFDLVPLAIGLKDCPAGTNVLIETKEAVAAGTLKDGDFWVNFN